jgi:glutathione synthase/RimK-type ligase-like ATP-grasp enzyme
VAIAKVGGIQAIVADMAKHLSDAYVQRYGCHVLQNLSYNDDNQVKIAKAGGIEAIVAAMERSGAEGEFRSNMHKGGSAKTIELNKKTEMAAIESAKLLRLTVAGVDLLESERGPLVIEVNSSPGLQGIEKATGIDVAEKIIEAAEKKFEKKQKLRAKTKAKKKKKKIKKSIKRQIERLML